MAKYEVVKEFLDRYDENKHLHPGDTHKPHSEDRAKQLGELGFIKVVADKPEVKKGNKGKAEPVTPAESTEPVTEVKEDKASDPDESSEAK